MAKPLLEWDEREVWDELGEPCLCWQEAPPYPDGDGLGVRF